MRDDEPTHDRGTVFDVSNARMAVMDGQMTVLDKQRGVWVRIGGPVSVTSIDEERQESPSAFGHRIEIECEVEHVDRDMLDKVFGLSARNAMASLVSERRIWVPRYDTVREYRRHPKGRGRCGRRGKARYVTVRNTYHDVRIEPRTSDGNEMTYELSVSGGYDMELAYDRCGRW